jgi:hypothetical protein
VLQGRYKSVTRMLQGCYKGVTRVLQECYKGVTRVLHLSGRSPNAARRLLRAREFPVMQLPINIPACACDKSVTRVLQRVFQRVLPKSVTKSVTRVRHLRIDIPACAWCSVCMCVLLEHNYNKNNITHQKCYYHRNGVVWCKSHT